VAEFAPLYRTRISSLFSPCPVIRLVHVRIIFVHCDNDCFIIAGYYHVTRIVSRMEVSEKQVFRIGFFIRVLPNYFPL